MNPSDGLAPDADDPTLASIMILSILKFFNDWREWKNSVYVAVQPGTAILFDSLSVLRCNSGIP